MRLINEAHSHSSSLKESTRRTPEQIFSKTKVNVNAKHYKPFGCLVFILDTALQLNNPPYKWKERDRVGICLSKSPQYDRYVSLVLSLTICLVSP